MNVNLTTSPMDITDYYKKYYTNDEKRLIIDYMNSLNELELKAIYIAKDHLKTSFDIIKSGGMKQWMQKQK